mmetsp:Transcript_8691/g.22366  ORF Transcript_8691/g.22366 Transcript_8691/m.22366 type:complete len:794 (+) Transcript_8691:292-2673(+)
MVRLLHSSRLLERRIIHVPISRSLVARVLDRLRPAEQQGDERHEVVVGHAPVHPADRLAHLVDVRVQLDVLPFLQERPLVRRLRPGDRILRTGCMHVLLVRAPDVREREPHELVEGLVAVDDELGTAGLHHADGRLGFPLAQARRRVERRAIAVLRRVGQVAAAQGVEGARIRVVVRVRRVQRMLRVRHGNRGSPSRSASSQMACPGALGAVAVRAPLPPRPCGGIGDLARQVLRVDLAHDQVVVEVELGLGVGRVLGHDPVGQLLRGHVVVVQVQHLGQAADVRVPGGDVVGVERGHEVVQEELVRVISRDQRPHLLHHLRIQLDRRRQAELLPLRTAHEAVVVTVGLRPELGDRACRRLHARDQQVEVHVNVLDRDLAGEALSVAGVEEGHEAVRHVHDVLELHAELVYALDHPRVLLGTIHRLAVDGDDDAAVVDARCEPLHVERHIPHDEQIASLLNLEARVGTFVADPHLIRRQLQGELLHRLQVLVPQQHQQGGLGIPDLSDHRRALAVREVVVRRRQGRRRLLERHLAGLAAAVGRPSVRLLEGAQLLILQQGQRLVLQSLHLLVVDLVDVVLEELECAVDGVLVHLEGSDGRHLQRVPVHEQLLQLARLVLALPQAQDGGRQLPDVVRDHADLLQVLALADRAGELLQLVEGEEQHLQLRHHELIGDCADLVVRQVQLHQVLAQGDAVGNRLQEVVGQVEVLEAPAVIGHHPEVGGKSAQLVVVQDKHLQVAKGALREDAGLDARYLVPLQDECVEQLALGQVGRKRFDVVVRHLQLLQVLELVE